MKRNLKLVASFALAALILVVALHRFDLRHTITFARQAHFGVLALGLACTVVAYLLRGVRWTIWETGLRYWDAEQLVLIGFMGNNVLPARLGEVLRAHCASAKVGEDRGRTALLASIAAERLLDGVVLAAFGLAGLSLVRVDVHLRWALLMASGLFAGLAVVAVFGIVFHERIQSLLAAGNRRFPGHVTAFAQNKASHFLNGLVALGTWPQMMRGIAATTIIWSLEIGSYYLVARAVWPHFSLRIAVLFMVVVNFASIIPLTMGGIGTIEAIAPPFLVSMGIDPSAALAMVLMQHAGQFLFTTIAGGLAYLGGGFLRIPLIDPKTGNVSEPSSGPAPRCTVPSAPVVETTRSSLHELGTTVDLKPRAKKDILLSILIPAYNEQARLPRTVLETLRWCTARGFEFELILADDGSRDETLAIARLFEASDSRVRALACPHTGKGATVRIGVLNARGRFVLFMDADGATPLDEIPKLQSALENGSDVAIGSRVVQHPGEVEVRTSSLRRFIGRSFAFFVNLLAVQGIADSQCGFKMFHREAAAAIFSRQKTVGFAFDVEILFIARRLGLSIAELPVNWRAQPGSKVNLVTDSCRMLWDISRIRWMHRRFENIRLPVISNRSLTVCGDAPKP